MPRIFISYRRDDSGYIASMLAERLEEVFGSDSVFIDVDAIPLGVDFREYLSQAVAKSDLMLALMGNEWLSVKNTQGLRRLDDPADFVRIEIEAALKRQIPVVPVLLEQASMPLEAELPPSLQPLVFRNAAEIRSGRDLNYHIEQLIRGIKNQYTVTASVVAADGQASEPKPAKVIKQPSEQPAGIADLSQTPTLIPTKTSLKPLFWLLAAVGVLAVLGWGINFWLSVGSDQTYTETNSHTLPNNLDLITEHKLSGYFQPCLAGTRNVIVGSGYDNRAEALARLQKFRAAYPDYKFKLLNTVASAAPYSNEQAAIIVGHGLDLEQASQLQTQMRNAGVATDAYISQQTVSADCVDLSGFEK